MAGEHYLDITTLLSALPTQARPPRLTPQLMPFAVHPYRCQRDDDEGCTPSRCSCGNHEGLQCSRGGHAAQAPTIALVTVPDTRVFPKRDGRRAGDGRDAGVLLQRPEAPRDALTAPHTYQRRRGERRWGQSNGVCRSGWGRSAAALRRYAKMERREPTRLPQALGRRPGASCKALVTTWSACVRRGGRWRHAALGALAMETPPSLPPLPIIVVEDAPIDLYLLQRVLTAHDLAHELHVIGKG